MIAKVTGLRSVNQSGDMRGMRDRPLPTSNLEHYGDMDRREGAVRTYAYRDDGISGSRGRGLRGSDNKCLAPVGLLYLLLWSMHCFYFEDYRLVGLGSLATLKEDL